jgi:hypothetical protein
MLEMPTGIAIDSSIARSVESAASALALMVATGIGFGSAGAG